MRRPNVNATSGIACGGRLLLMLGLGASSISSSLSVCCMVDGSSGSVICTYRTWKLLCRFFDRLLLR